MEPLKRGDRVRFKGGGRDWEGTVSTRKWTDGTISIHPKNEYDKVFVMFDDTGTSVPIFIAQLEKVSTRKN